MVLGFFRAITPPFRGGSNLCRAYRAGALTAGERCQGLSQKRPREAGAAAQGRALQTHAIMVEVECKTGIVSANGGAGKRIEDSNEAAHYTNFLGAKSFAKLTTSREDD